jgi:hypothetical protein
MIIVFADDRTVAVLSDIAEVRSECETIDVEGGVYHFFDHCGQRLQPRFITNVRRSFWFGDSSEKTFELELDPEDDGSQFDTLLANAVAVDPPNASFATLAQVANYISENRRLHSSAPNKAIR